LEQQYQDLVKIFERLKSENLSYTAEVFSLASNIKEILNSNLPPHYREVFSNIKSQLPKFVQALTWGSKMSLTSKAFADEHLSASFLFELDGPRLVFMSNVSEIEKNYPQFKFHFSTAEGGNYLIQNVWSNEFLYPDEKGEVSLWRWEILEESAYWKVDIVDNDTIRLRDLNNNFMAAEKETSGLGRKVFVREKNLCESNCEWIVGI
jgi:hypothetical protein